MPDTRVSAVVMTEMLSGILAQDIIGRTHENDACYDLPQLENGLKALKIAFPPTTLHTTTGKANPLIEVIRRLHTHVLVLKLHPWAYSNLTWKSDFESEELLSKLLPKLTRN